MPLSDPKTFDPNRKSAAANIGQWTEAKLARFVQTAIASSPANLPKALKVREVRATDRLVVDAELVLSDRAITYLKNKLGL